MLKKALLMGAAWGAVCCYTASALAQTATAQNDATAQSAETAGSGETVVVTGTRLGVAGINTPTPVTAVSSDQLQASAPSNLADALNNLPSLVQSGGQQNNAGSSSTGKNLLNLRGLGTTRTLILLDGERFPSTQNTNTVDINVLPQALVQRVDIVTGGASASYGSDAVAGAVNFVLNDHYEGFGATLIGGATGYGDNKEIHGTANFGTSFLSDHLHVIGSLEYFDNFGVPGNARPFRVTDANVIVAPTGAGFSTTYIGIPNLHGVGSYGGFVSGATGGAAAAQAKFVDTQFNNAGQLIPYNEGTDFDGSYQSGGDGVDTSVNQDISRPLRRRTAFLRSEYEFNSDLSGYVEGLYGHTDAEQNNSEFAVGANALTISTANPYLAPSLATSLAASGITSLTVTKYFPYYPSESTAQSDSFEYKNNDRTTTQVAIGGFNGKLGRFSWGVSGTYGYTREYTSSTNDLDLPALQQAANVVTNPATGQPTCASTLTNPTNGCVPIDIFGTNNLSQSAINYITGTNPVVYDNQTEGAAAHITGELFNLPAGPVAGALGGEFRRQRDVVMSNALGLAQAWQLGTVQPWIGGYDVSEGYTELDFPILANDPWAESLDIDLAARETDYSTSGAVTTWKVGSVYKPIDEVTIRATVSRDIRAPNLSELFTVGAQGTTNVTDPLMNNAQDKGIRQVTTGNPNLKPERGTTFTAGVAYEPAWLPGLTATVDYYDIRVEGVIASPTTQNVINFCASGSTSYCQYVTRNSAGTITQVTVPSLNLTSLHTNGVDIEADYNIPAEDWFGWWKGNLSVRTIANYLGLLTTQNPGAQTLYNAGSIGNSTPHWKVLSGINYDLGDWSTFLQVRYVGAGIWNPTYNDPNYTPYQTTNFNLVNSATYFDVQETYHIGKAMQIYLNVQNVFNLQPQFSPSNASNAQTTNEALYDQLGRMFRVGIKYNY
jgi:iron complex outermembrane receptor protein